MVNTNLIIYFLFSFSLLLFHYVLYSQDDSTNNINFSLDDYIATESQKLINFIGTDSINFNKFKWEIDSVYNKFKSESWESFDINVFDFEINKSPINLPVYIPETNQPVELLPPKESKFDFQSLYIQENQELDLDNSDLKLFRETAPSIKSLTFYGKQIDIYYDKESLPILKDISTTAIEDFFRQAESIIYTTRLIKQISRKLNLNDWGKILLIRFISKKLFNSHNEQELFLAYSIIQNGFDAKVAFGKENIFVFVSAENRISDYSFYKDNREYYWIKENEDLRKPPNLVIAKGIPQATRKVSTLFYDLPLIGQVDSTKTIFFDEHLIKIDLNTEYVKYLNDFPYYCELQNYFMTPLSEVVLNSLDSFFVPYFMGKSDTAKINILLRFFYQSFPLLSDNVQFGYENYLYPDETIYYRFSDCEDRAVLLARLVEHYSSLNAIGLNYKDHVSIAIAFSQHLDCDFIIYNKRKYYYCDPSYINAPIGNCPPELKNVQFEVINYEYYMRPYKYY